MTLDQDLLTAIALAGAGVAVLATALAVRANVRASRIRRGLRALQAAGAGRDLVLTGEELAKKVDSMANELEILRDAVVQAVQGVGVVRFDAFEDMGGHLSFSAAFLDGRGHGVVLSSINGRTETRIYAKPVEAATSRYNLSEEEQEAIRRALAAQR